MKWVDKEILETKELLALGKTYGEISEITKREKNAIRIKMGRLGIGYQKLNPKLIKKCINCSNEILNYGDKFCSSSCSATYNNKIRPKKEYSKNKNESINKRKRENYRLRKNKVCVNCNTITTNKYCGSKCQNEYRIKLVFDKIKNGDITLNSRQYKKYLIDKYGNKCMECGWDKVNPVTGKVPIELEHIDGNSTNNKLENLKLLCPNCHSLTPTYKALNIGKGRHSRRERYKNGQSY